MKHVTHPHPFLASPDNPDLLGADWEHGEYCTQVSSLEQMRCLLGPESAMARKRRSRVYFRNRQMRARGRLLLGIHDRAEEYLFADGRISDRDLPNVQRHLPFRLKVLRHQTLRLKAGEVLDVTSSHAFWPGLHFREELYVHVNIDRLVVEPGAQVTVRGNLLVWCCGEIVVDRRSPGGGSAENNADGTPFDLKFNILGTEHSAFSSIRRLPATDGRAGRDGIDGTEIAEALEPAGIFGPSAHAVTRPAMSGSAMFGAERRALEAGGDAGHGEDGTSGTNGGMAMLADIRLDKLTGFRRDGLVIFAQAGTGGDGGAGGNGGRGGNGAPPGAGGDAGNGGRGGNGGLSSNIFVQLPASERRYVKAAALPSVAGKGGRAGRAGAGGSSDSFSGSSDNPKVGGHGKPGRPGQDGRGRGAPDIHFINQRGIDTA